MLKLRCFALLLALGMLLGQSVLAQRPQKITIKPQAYRGWSDALLMSNGVAEIVIVPSIGRVMQFRLAGESSGVFWENEALAGKAADAQSTTWGNFGGDKSWPAPQSDWPKVTPRGWPPPVAFDAMPCEAKAVGDAVELRTPVDPHYGIRVVRTIRLDAKRPVMRIITSYEKVAGEPRKVSIWVITQLHEPVAVYVPLPKQSVFADGYVLQSKNAPPSLKRSGQLLSLTRDKQAAFKIGTDAETMLWIGEKYALRIDAPRQPNAEYPDNGSSAEVYTNQDPLAYVELETLGPLREMKQGDRYEQTNTYLLTRRVGKDASTEAHKLFLRK